MTIPDRGKIPITHLLLLFAFALLGYGAVFLLFPRLNPAAHWGLALDRAAAIAKAAETTSRFGLDVTGWRSKATAAYKSNLDYYLSLNPNSPATRLFTPVQVEVTFSDNNSKRKLIVALNAKGEAIGFRRQNFPNPAETVSDLQKDRELAEAAVKQMFGQMFVTLPALKDEGLSNEGRKFTWTISDQLLNLNVEVLVRDEHVSRITFDTNFTPRFQTRFDARRGQLFDILSNAEQVIIWPAVIFIAIFYIYGLALKQIRHRSTLFFLCLLFLLLILTNSFGSLVDANFSFGGDPLPRWAERLLFDLIFIMIYLVLSTVLYFCWAAGLALARRTPNRRTIGLELLLEGKVLTVPVTNSFLTGVLFSGILSAVPYFLAATKILPGMELNPEGFEDILLPRSPTLASFNGSGLFLLFVTFSFIAPLLDVFIKRRVVARSLFFIIAFLMLLGAGTVSASLPALLLVALLEALLFTTIYYRHGLLAVLAAGMASRALLNAAVLYAQPATALQHSGRNLLIVLGSFAVITLVGRWKSREISDAEIFVPPGALVSRSERERLKAELSVARLAQERILPGEPPQLDALDIAAVCLPSREVGGDLYDFIPMPDGKLGIVVADVSGKGVPASLYMTLTKGLLDSVLQDIADPGEALRLVNRHLYKVCGRKVFVTLFLGIIDPAEKSLVYARAGHNPTVFRRASEQSTLFLKSPGMGLGLNDGKIFDTTLKVSRLQLEPNDTLLFYSDGITEAMNEKNEEYGEERLMKISDKFDGVRACQACALVMEDVKSFLGPIHPQDDQTIVIVRVREEPA
ncbi:MAG: PP2C family protein-serine/threonine phosphatase [Blastocatellia bacterium]|nr:PP2C family protein-serine/threonine phosphatase [Blastocatellia bacterium]